MAGEIVTWVPFNRIIFYLEKPVSEENLGDIFAKKFYTITERNGTTKEVKIRKEECEHFEKDKQIMYRSIVLAAYLPSGQHTNVHIEQNKLTEIIRDQVLNNIKANKLLGIDVVFFKSLRPELTIFTKYVMRSEKDLKKYTFNKSLKSEWSEPCLLDNDDEENLRVITNIGVGIPIVENLLNNVSDLRPYMNEVRELSESQSKSSYPLSAQGISAVETGSFVSLAPSAPSYEDVMYQLYNVSLDNGRFYFCGTKILFDPANHAYFDEQYNVWIKPPEFENGIQYGWRYFDNKSQQWYGVPEPKKNVPNELLQIFPPYLIPVNYDGAAAYRVYGRYEPGSAATSSAAAPSSNSSGRGDLGNKKQKENSDEKTGKDSCCIIM